MSEPRWRRYLRFWKRSVSADIDDELDFHFAQRLAQYRDAGLSESEAQAAAHAQFGNLNEVRDGLIGIDNLAARRADRRARGIAVAEQVAQALRHALRRLRRRPGYSLAVVASLALGLGLTTTIFAIFDAVVTRHLPYPNESRLLTVGRIVSRGPADAQTTRTTDWSTYDHDLNAWLEGSRTLQSIAVLASTYETAAGPAGPAYMEEAAASPNLLEVLGTSVAVGRWFTPSEVRERVVVISDRLWQNQFAGDSAVLGRTLAIQGEPWTVIGVMRRDAALPLTADYWVPYLPGFEGQVIARSKAGVGIDAVRAELASLSPGIRNLRQAGYAVSVVVVPLREQLFRNERPLIRLLFGAAALLLVIACANISNLSLARSLEGRREFAVRLTLGADRWSIASIVLAENGILAVVGAACGALLAVWWTHLAVAIAPGTTLRVVEIGVNSLAVFFVGSAAMIAALLISVAPITSATNRDVQPLLGNTGAGSSRGRGSQRVRRVLMATQLALALVLMTAAGLLIRSVARMTRPEHLGFSPKHVVVATVRLLSASYLPVARRTQFTNELLTRVKALPAVEAVGLGPPPLVGGRGEGVGEGFDVLIAFRDTTRSSVSSTIWVKYIDEGYLETYRIRLLAGRAFRAGDDSLAPRVAILNATAAKLLLSSRSPIGQPLTVPGLKSSSGAMRVVGIVDDVLQRDLAIDANPEILLPAAQQSGVSIGPTLAVRASGSTETIVGAIRKALLEIDPNLAAMRLESMDAIVHESLARHRFLLSLLAVFASLALTLSVVGLYGVVSYLVSQRTLEIGVRVALGAQPRHVIGLVLGEGTRLIVTGLAIGLPGAFALTQLLVSFIYGITPHDPLTFAVVPVLLCVVALVAAVVPAWRAVKVDPAKTLRAE